MNALRSVWAAQHTGPDPPVNAGAVAPARNLSRTLAFPSVTSKGASPMADRDAPKRDTLWSLIDDNPTCMLVTHEEDGDLRARPMRAIIERDRGELWFYTRLDSGKSAEIARDGAACACFGCPKSNDYVSVTGDATLGANREMIHKHWSRFVDAWFPDGPDGGDVGMIRLVIKEAEYWDGSSSSVLNALKMLRASGKDETPDLGENEKIARFSHA
jgi:general stress protein 26